MLIDKRGGKNYANNEFIWREYMGKYTEEQLALLEKIMPENPGDMPHDDGEEISDEEWEQYEEECNRYEQLNVSSEANTISFMYDEMKEALFSLMLFYSYYDELPDEIKNKVSIVAKMKELIQSKDRGMYLSEIRKTFNVSR